jgi:TolB protein
LRQLTSFDEEYPAFSPDGTTIVFTSRPADQFVKDPGDYAEREMWSEIYTMSSRGENVKRLTQNEKCDNEASFSPDGTKIVFVSYRDNKLFDIGVKGNIYIMNTDGSNQIRLTSSTCDSSPAFSLNGKYIAFVSNRGGKNEIYIMNADGTDQRRLTYDKANNTSPQWIG